MRLNQWQKKEKERERERERKREREKILPFKDWLIKIFIDSNHLRRHGKNALNHSENKTKNHTEKC